MERKKISNTELAMIRLTASFFLLRNILEADTLVLKEEKNIKYLRKESLRLLNYLLEKNSKTEDIEKYYLVMSDFYFDDAHQYSSYLSSFANTDKKGDPVEGWKNILSENILNMIIREEEDTWEKLNDRCDID